MRTQRRGRSPQHATNKIFHKCIVAAGFLTCTVTTAHADWAQSLGIGQKSTNLGGAVTATADDYDVFYTNPAGAANFDGPFIGIGAKVFDTRGLSVRQSGATQPGAFQNLAGNVLQSWGQKSLANLFTAPKNGLDISPERTLPNADIALVPSGAGYMPIPGMKNVVVGVGMGAPFLVSADYGHGNVPGNYGRFDTTSAGLVVIETSPTVAMKVNDSLNVGASVGITTLKYFQVSAELGAPSLKIGGLTVPLGAGSIGRYNMQTDSTVHLPGIEPSFAPGGDVSFTLGMQYKITPKLTGGVTYRSKTGETFEGTLSTTVDCLGLQNSSGCVKGLSVGPYNFKDHFRYQVELPAHVQTGLAYEVTPSWRVMADVRWTNWSDAKGFGTPSVITLKDGTTDPGGAIISQGGLLGLGAKLVGIKSAPVKSITVNYAAHDTVSLHFGTAYKLTPQLELQAGYIYDPSFMPDNSVDLITLSSNRHIFSLGAGYTIPASDGEWVLTAGGQFVQYEDRHIDANSNQNLGGLNGITQILSNQQNLQYGRNTLGGFDIGGYVWSAGGSVTYKFGAKTTQLEIVDQTAK